ncbi:MAG: OsmC family protein [Anaerolineae bacterium]|nr:OsmC family protein [Anaerolineae bacterium]MDW8101035.1 OsmC family protein [Anaerolineae bacterium]
MADIRRTAEAVWYGDLRGGNGKISSASGVLKDVPYSFATRFENSPGTNPEELIAAAHAACYSMAFAHTLSGKGYKPESIETRAICHLTPQPTGGFRITKMRLETRGRVPGLDEATFQQIALEAEKGCPVSNALRSIEIEVDAKLVS